MACPFFMPDVRCDDILWAHPARLPLGHGYSGRCAAPGHEGTQPTDAQLKDNCNLGYARSCPRLPAERAADAVRYIVSLEGDERIVITYICERDHAPVEHGSAEYDCVARSFRVPHADPRIHRQLECYLASYLLRRPSARAAAATTTQP